jgi:hypothetical protein
MPKASRERSSDTPDWQLSTFGREGPGAGSANRTRGILGPPAGVQKHGIGAPGPSLPNVDNCQSGVSLLRSLIFPKWTV